MTGDMAVSLAIDKLRAALQDLAYQKMLIRSLLDQVGVPAHCKWCGAPILWVRPAIRQKADPYNPDGSGHFASCTKTAELRRRQIQPVTTNSKGDGKDAR